MVTLIGPPQFVFAPPNALRKVRFTVTVRLFPDAVADVPDPFNVHWLLDTLDPAVTGPRNVFPASFTRKNLLVDGKYAVQQPLVATRLPLIS